MTRSASLLIAALLTASPAVAQPAPVTNPQEQLERLIGQLVTNNINLQAQVQAATARADALQKQIDEAKKAKPEEAPK